MFGYIYKTTNLINGKIYVGKRQSSIFDENYYGSGKYFKRALKKYGKSNFSREVLEWCSNLNDLLQQEKYWIDKLNSRDLNIGYNIVEGGWGATGFKHTDKFKKSLSDRYSGAGHPLYGTHLSDSTKKKISDSHKRFNAVANNKWYNNGVIERLINLNTMCIPDGFVKGRLKSSIDKMAAAHKGLKLIDNGNWGKCKGKSWFTNGTIDIMAFDCPNGYWKGRSNLDITGENNPMYGKESWNKGLKMSDESKEKLRLANSGKNSYWYGKHWYNNGIEEKPFSDSEVPNGYIKGRLKIKDK